MDVIDSGAEALLVGPGWNIVHTCSRDVGASLALPNNTQQSRRMQLVDAH